MIDSLVTRFASERTMRSVEHHGMPSRFQQSLCEYVLGVLDSRRLVEVAYFALEDGFESTELAALAGESRDTDPPDLREQFERALVSAGISKPSLEGAGRVYSSRLCRELLAGEREPIETVDAIFFFYMSRACPQSMRWLFSFGSDSDLLCGDFDARDPRGELGRSELARKILESARAHAHDDREAAP